MISARCTARCAMFGSGTSPGPCISTIFRSPQASCTARSAPPTVAHADILKPDLSAVRRHPGVVLVFTSKDVPGVNDVLLERQP